MYAFAAIALKIIYLLLPVASLFAAIWVRRSALRRQVTGAWVSGILVGSLILVGFTFVIGGVVPWQQVALTLYLGVSLMLFLKTIDFLLRLFLTKLMRHFKASRKTIMAAMALRSFLFACFALPWIMSALTVYRPRVISFQSAPNSPLINFVEIHFRSRDGTMIAGWWIGPNNASNTSALLCHGLGGSKADFIPIIQQLHEQDIGVLAIDLRAHSQSGGQISTFGANESRDVLAALDWLKIGRASQAERIIGVGESIGAAALLKAASTDQRLDGIAVISTFDTLQNELTSIADSRLFPPINWLVRSVGLAMASLHSGTDLSAVRPIENVATLWPRPVLVIHATQDDIIPFALGRRVHDAASPPRDDLWIDGVTHNGFLENADVIRRVVQFVRWARPVPVI